MDPSLYREMEAVTIRNHSLRCIDGTIHGSGKCVGFCAFEPHVGFLTAQHERARQCREQGCRYYHPKPAACRVPRRDNAEEKRVMEAARAATAQMEGLRVLRCVGTPSTGWTVYFAAVARYDVTNAETHAATIVDSPVHLVQIPCHFDTAVALVTGKQKGW